MSAFPPSGLTRSRLNKVYISNELYVNTIKPYNTAFPITIEGGSVVLDDIVLTDENSFVGDGAGDAITTGIYNVFLGSNAGNLNTTGSSNIFLGSDAGSINTTGSFNVFIGENSGANSTTSFLNICIGRWSGLNMLSSSSNVFIGASSGQSITTGSSNVFIGTNAGAAVDDAVLGCVLIGNNAGRFNITNNRLMIDNTDTEEPLLNGIFDPVTTVATLQINGVTTIGGAADTTSVHRVNGGTLVSAPLPIANPDGYLRINIKGTEYKMPYWVPGAV